MRASVRATAISHLAFACTVVLSNPHRRSEPASSMAGFVAERSGCMNRSCLVSVLAVALILAACRHSTAATYYVATSGDDAASGTSGSPWKTIQQALNTAAPGDTVLVGAGVYAERVTVSRSGTAGAPITLQNTPGTTPIIDGTGLGGGIYGGLVTIQGAAYVTLRGLTIRNSEGLCVAVSGNAAHVELNGLEVYGCQNGIWIEGATSPAYTIVRASKVHDTVQGGITVWRAPGGYYLIEQNEVYRAGGTNNFDAIQVGSYDGASNHVVVRQNVVHDSGSSGADPIDVGGHACHDHYLVEANDMYATSGDFKLHGNGVGLCGALNEPHAIARFNRLTGVGSVTYDFPNTSAFYNNTIVGPPHGLQIWSDNPSALPGSNVGSAKYGTGPGGKTDYGRQTWKNNIFWKTSNRVVFPNGVAGYRIDVRYSSIRLDHNLVEYGSGYGHTWYTSAQDLLTTDFPDTASGFASYQGTAAPDVPDTGSILTTASDAAVFVNAAGRDYHLVSGSPAIDAGTPLTRTVGSGSGTKTLTVERASYFQDGYGGLIQPDQIVVGSNPPVAIVSIDDDANTITVATALSWASGDPVTLPFSGKAPDAGAWELTSTPPASPPKPPTLLGVDVAH